MVQASANPTQGPTPLVVNFSSAGSSDPEGKPLTYSWNFGDNTTSTAANPTHTYNVAGPYQVRLTVSDGVNSTTLDAAEHQCRQSADGNHSLPDRWRIVQGG